MTQTNEIAVLSEPIDFGVPKKYLDALAKANREVARQWAVHHGFFRASHPTFNADTCHCRIGKVVMKETT